MKMIPDAKTVALKSYSMWANYCGIAAMTVTATGHHVLIMSVMPPPVG